MHETVLTDKWNSHVCLSLSVAHTHITHPPAFCVLQFHANDISLRRQSVHHSRNHASTFESIFVAFLYHNNSRSRRMTAEKKKSKLSIIVWTCGSMAQSHASRHIVSDITCINAMEGAHRNRAVLCCESSVSLLCGKWDYVRHSFVCLSSPVLPLPPNGHKTVISAF